MLKWREHHLLVPMLGVVALVAAACERPAQSVDPAVRRPEFWVGCNAGSKFTGGGRVDPSGVGKVTFGFNIHAGDCSGTDIKGQMQVVYHETQTLIHTLTMEKFASYTDSLRGECAEWSGTARLKDVFAGSGWSDHTYFTVVCDKAEPGRGADRFSFYLDNAGDGTHNNVIDEVLTGGNIQAHKS